MPDPLSCPTAEDVGAYLDTLTRDVCAYCQAAPTGRQELDHILARAAGGDESTGNLTGACKLCNTLKRDQPLIDFLAHQREIAAHYRAGGVRADRPSARPTAWMILTGGSDSLYVQCVAPSAPEDWAPSGPWRWTVRADGPAASGETFEQAAARALDHHPAALAHLSAAVCEHLRLALPARPLHLRTIRVRRQRDLQRRRQAAVLLRERRLAVGLTQAELAARATAAIGEHLRAQSLRATRPATISARTVSDWERERVAAAGATSLGLALALNAPDHDRWFGPIDPALFLPERTAHTTDLICL